MGGYNKDYGKIRRPSAADYINASIALKDMPSYTEFIADIRTQWMDQFTEAERHGKDGNAPISFAHYITLSQETLVKQRDEVIPKMFKEGKVSAEDAAAATEIANMGIEYIDQCMRSKDFF
jgi:hypothetical protein